MAVEVLDAAVFEGGKRCTNSKQFTWNPRIGLFAQIVYRDYLTRIYISLYLLGEGNGDQEALNKGKLNEGGVWSVQRYPYAFGNPRQQRTVRRSASGRKCRAKLGIYLDVAVVSCTLWLLGNRLLYRARKTNCAAAKYKVWATTTNTALPMATRKRPMKRSQL